MFDGPLEKLTKLIAALPGLGNRSAKRIALYLLTHKETSMAPLSRAIDDCMVSISTCTSCGNLDNVQPCRICRDGKRDPHTICVVANIADLWAIERTQAYKGQFHVLGGVLSALDGISRDDLAFDLLMKKIQQNNTKEIIIALSATVDGQSTAHVLIDMIQEINKTIIITKLAHGVPIGGELDYLDDGTITTALHARANL